MIKIIEAPKVNKKNILIVLWVFLNIKYIQYKKIFRGFIIKYIRI